MIFPTKQAKRDKYLLRLEREYRRLCEVSDAAPVIALETPYHRGWTKTFVLRDDILRRRDASTFRRILLAINDRVYCRSPSFTDRHGKRFELRPRIIPAREWPKLQWPENHKRHFLFGYWKQPIAHFRWDCYERLVFGYKLACDYILKEQIEPYFVTHVRTELPEVRKRIAEIEKYYADHQGRERLGRLHGSSWRHWYRWQWSAPELRSRASESEVRKELFDRDEGF